MGRARKRRAGGRGRWYKEGVEGGKLGREGVRGWERERGGGKREGGRWWRDEGRGGGREVG